MKKIIAILGAILIGMASIAWAGPTVSGGGGSGSGVQTDSNCNQAKYFTIGVLCQDTDDGKLYKGTGAAVEEVGGASTLYWNNGGKTMTNPSAVDFFQHFRAFVARHLTQATMSVVGGTSVVAKLQKCTAVGASCSDISDALTVNAGAEGTFLYSAAAINTSLSAGDAIYLSITTVTGAVTSLTVNLGGVIP